MNTTSPAWRDRLTHHLATARRPLLAVVGPTASGKTAFSIALARAVGESGRTAEIINADSRQLYGFLDIGTAKVTPAEAEGVPHHLLSVLDPREEVTVARYKEMAEAAIDDALSRGAVPVLVGGSMLYLSAVLDGLELLPAGDPRLRRRLEEEYDRDGGAALHARLAALDPESAAGIDPRNKPYVVRALEILESTGTPASAQKRMAGCRYDALIFGMRWPRAELTARIDERTRLLLRSGWIEEVEGLLARGYRASDPGMKSHGYREIAAWIAAGKPAEGFDGLAERIAANTRQYAKRQMTWWKGDGRISWIDQAALRS